MHDHIFGPFAFAEKETINVTIFLDVLESPSPQVHDLPCAGDICLQLDSAAPHYMM